MEEKFGMSKKNYGTEADTETWSWFRLLLPKLCFGRTLIDPIPIIDLKTFRRAWNTIETQV